MSNVMIKTPYGAWQYVKQRKEGLTYSIYNIGCLIGEDALQLCKKQYPQFEFKLEQIKP